MSGILIRPARLFALVVLTLAVTQGLAHAQGLVVPPRASQGLFGGIRPDETATKRLEVSVSLVEGYDQDIPYAIRPAIDPTGLQSGGFSTGVDSTGNFTLRTHKSEFGANFSSTLRHYAEGEVQGNLGHSAGIGYSRQIMSKTNLSINQSAQYSPTYMYGLFPVTASVAPGAAPPTSLDYSVGRFESYTYVTTLAVRRDFTRRNSFTATGDYQYSNRLRETDLWNDVSAYGVRGEYLHNVARNTVLTGAVRYRTGEYGYTGQGKTTEAGGNFGIDYMRPLSATRRVTLGLDIGVSRTELPLTVTGFDRRLHATADVDVGYVFARTWEARVNVRRGLEYLVDFPTPVFSNGVSGGLDGLLSQRFDVSLFAGYSDGASVDTLNTLQISTATGTARGRYALNRKLAVYIEYLRYYYRFRGNAVPLFAAIPPRWDRSGVRAGLTLWVPMLGR